MIERMGVTGGQATSISLDKEKYGTSWMNDGVQGGSPAFKHTFNFFRRYGHEPQELKLQVSFGQGKDTFWTNVFPSQLVEQFSGDIQKFGKVLKIIKWTMPVLGLVPIKVMLRMFFFSKDFGDKMVLPLIALFLGTGTVRSFFALMQTVDFNQHQIRQSNAKCILRHIRAVVRRSKLETLGLRLSNPTAEFADNGHFPKVRGFLCRLGG